MELISGLIDFILHIDKHLAEIVQQYQTWTYAILFVIVFLETGLVATPFLPGDSLLFASGALAGTTRVLDPWVLFLLLSIAGVLGDTVNYWIGSFLGPRVMRSEKSRIFRREYLDLTHQYFERYGGATIVIARFVPIVRTFAPFVAGVGRMTYSYFLFYNVIGSLLWVGLCVFAGYFFGGFEFVKKNFSLVVLAIIVISVLPAVFEFLRHWAKRPKAGVTPTPQKPESAA